MIWQHAEHIRGPQLLEQGALRVSSEVSAFGSVRSGMSSSQHRGLSSSQQHTNSSRRSSLRSSDRRTDDRASGEQSLSALLRDNGLVAGRMMPRRSFSAANLSLNLASGVRACQMCTSYMVACQMQSLGSCPSPRGQA